MLDTGVCPFDMHVNDTERENKQTNEKKKHHVYCRGIIDGHGLGGEDNKKQLLWDTCTCTQNTK